MNNALAVDSGLLRYSYRNIQALRAVAALMVVIGHVRLGMGFDTIILRAPMWYSGVDVFFVISGFIVSIVAVRAGLDPSDGRVSSTWRFCVRRVVRIYPIYWIVLAVSVLLTPWFTIKPDWMGYQPMLNYVLLITKENAYVPQAWSMTFEVFFYVVLGAILFAAPRRIFEVLAVWMAAQLALYVYATVTGMPDPRIITDAQVFEFGFGCSVAYLVLQGARSYAWITLLVGLLFFAAGTIWTDQAQTLLTGGPRTITFGIGAACIVYAAVVCDLKGWIAPRFMQRVGGASYSLYLWHDLLLIVLTAFTISSGIMDAVPHRILFLAWIGIIVLAAFMSYHWLEKPMIRVLNRLLGAGGRAQVAT